MTESNFEGIFGKWLKVGERGIAEYMAALGSDAPPNARITIEWLQGQTGAWIQILQLNEVSRAQIFKLGKHFEHESFDGSAAKSTITIEGNRMVQVQIHNGKEMQITREFTGDKMNTRFTLAGSDAVATNEFERVKRCEYYTT